MGSGIVLNAVVTVVVDFAFASVDEEDVVTLISSFMELFFLLDEMAVVVVEYIPPLIPVPGP